MMQNAVIIEYLAQEYNSRNPGKLTGFYGSKHMLGSHGRWLLHSFWINKKGSIKYLEINI